MPNVESAQVEPLWFPRPLVSLVQLLQQSRQHLATQNESWPAPISEACGSARDVEKFGCVVRCQSSRSTPFIRRPTRPGAGCRAVRRV